MHTNFLTMAFVFEIFIEPLIDSYFVAKLNDIADTSLSKILILKINIGKIDVIINKSIVINYIIVCLQSLHLSYIIH